MPNLLTLGTRLIEPFHLELDAMAEERGFLQNVHELLKLSPRWTYIASSADSLTKPSSMAMLNAKGMGKCNLIPKEDTEIFGE